jgi:hypothetical protein
MKRFLALACLSLVPAPAAGQAISAPAAARGVDAVVNGISAQDFTRRVGVLAHDSLRGRETPSPELAQAALWIAEEFRRFGLAPGGDAGSFIQMYPVRGGSRGASSRGSAQVVERAPNVVAILRGSDPELRDEYVVFSAHMDHLGVSVPDARGDSIYNGADDNASGTAAVMEIAEAMAALPVAPRRSAMFVLVSGEEKGLWGSEHFVDNPPVPIDRLVADINLDMVGRNWSDTIVVIGREHSDLGGTLARVNAAHPELGMTAIDDLWPEERFFFRSDHYNFARRGVPALFFFNGVHADYHRPSDSAEKIDVEKASRVARLVFHLGIEIANAAERPRWNPESYRAIVQPGLR